MTKSFENIPAPWGIVMPKRSPEEMDLVEKGIEREYEKTALEQELALVTERVLAKIELLKQESTKHKEVVAWPDVVKILLLRTTQLVGIFTLASAGTTALMNVKKEREWQTAVEKNLQTFKSSRYNVKKIEKKDGSVRYEHQDRETTEIIDYLAGRQGLGTETHLTCLRQIFAGNYDKENKFTEEIYNLKTEDDASRFLVEHFSDFKKNKEAGSFAKGGLMNKYKNADQFAQTEIEAIVRWHSDYRKKISPQLYEALWRIEASSGNPKIRWAKAPEMKYINRAGVGSNSYYVEQKNTIYLDSAICTYGLLSDYSAEQAHAQNREQDPKEFLLRNWREEMFIQNYYNIYGTLASEREVYDGIMYNAPGTEEYLAHNNKDGKEKVIYEEYLAPIVKKPEGTININPYEDQE